MNDSRTKPIKSNSKELIASQLSDRVHEKLRYDTTLDNQYGKYAQSSLEVILDKLSITRTANMNSLCKYHMALEDTTGLFCVLYGYGLDSNLKASLERTVQHDSLIRVDEVNSEYCYLLLVDNGMYVAFFTREGKRKKVSCALISFVALYKYSIQL